MRDGNKNSNTPSWYLINGEKLAEEYASTFHRPTKEEINAVDIGSAVKLIFGFNASQEEPEAERMWVKITSHRDPGVYEGELSNHPRYIRDLFFGDLISFRNVHIVAIESRDPSLKNDFLHLRCFVSKQVQEQKMVGYLYREKPDEDTDSGWRFLGGDESDDYLEEASNFDYVSLHVALNFDDDITPFLKSPIGSTFERISGGKSFVKLE